MQIQLLGYLGTLQQTAGLLGFEKLHPAGVFYVPLKDEKILPAKDRTKALQIEPEDVEARFQHRGRFARELMELFDSRANHPKGTQFYYKRNNDGGLHKTWNEAVDAEWFTERLSHIENHLRAMGRRIYAGEIAPNPYQVKAIIACKECDYAGICRIDPATHGFRILTPAT
jgi:ATP-dependent helicase/DNAse subunit B